MRKIYLILVFCAISIILRAQTSAFPEKIIESQRTHLSIKIDGILNETDWAIAKETAGFIQRSPVPGAPASVESNVRILYDDIAIYVGAYLKDTSNLISRQFTQRDALANADWFGMIFCPYQDGINGVGFITTPAGVQFDTKYSSQGEDTGWDAIWESSTKIVDDGWIVELAIPYSALRFPNKEEQKWDINFVRNVNRLQETSFWYPVDRQIAGFLTQTGKLNGIKNIKPPLRLALTPFVAGYLENYNDRDPVNPYSAWGRSFNAGMDVKLGLGDAFTLDMTLIPDFGEAQSDNNILNLSPFEVRFDENRQFFTEGTELFNKADLFYSRRAGGRPLHSASDFLLSGESIIEEPGQVQLYNATKISGRTDKGTGLGFFNAVSRKTEAVVRNVNGEDRLVQTSPLSNYNVSVIDQNLKNNSFISLINTNVLRKGADYDANVTGMVFDFKDKKQSYSINGNAKLSQKFFESHDRYAEHISNLPFILDTEKDRLMSDGIDKNLEGHAYGIGIDKISGKVTGTLNYNAESHTFDINDLGFQRVANSHDFAARLRYSHFEPFGKFNAMGAGMNLRYSRIFNPNLYSDHGANVYWWGELKNFWSFETWVYAQPFNELDFYETRTLERYLKKPRFGMMGFQLSSDRRKRFIFEVFGGAGSSFEFYDSDWGNIGFNVDLNVSDRLKFNINSRKEYDNNDVGFISNSGLNDENIIMGMRDVSTWNHRFTTSFIFTKNMNLNLRLRHYWSSVEYNRFQELTQDGLLTSTDYDAQHDFSLNYWNIDMVYQWRFAPGSDLFVIWKNAISDFTDDPNSIEYQYLNSLSRLNEFPMNNSLSMKLVYYLDYARIM